MSLKWDTPEPSDGAPKRRGKASCKHAVGRVILISAVLLALIIGLGTVYLGSGKE